MLLRFDACNTEHEQSRLRRSLASLRYYQIFTLNLLNMCICISQRLVTSYQMPWVNKLKFLLVLSSLNMSNSTTPHQQPPSTQPNPAPPPGLQLSPIRYDTNFLPTVTTHQTPAPFEPHTLHNLPYPIHRERNTVATTPRPIISSDILSIEKENTPTPNNATILPTVGPELLNNEVVISNQQPVVVSEHTQEGDNSGALVPGTKTGQTYVDITEYLNMPQSEAAKKLGIPTSTLSKRWKEAVRGRKWPYRMICKLDKEIMTLLHNVPQGTQLFSSLVTQGTNTFPFSLTLHVHHYTPLIYHLGTNGAAGVTPPFPEEMENTLTRLIRLRNEELKSVVIRI